MTTPVKTSKIVGIWLMLGSVMIIIQILLGGITRLTGSGLSITEWKPILGFLPPLNEQEWLRAFQEYQKIAQFKQLNSHFSLSDFKFIYFWEWFHRLWARFLGLVFIVPFIFFIARGYFQRSQIKQLIILFSLGALQGLIGWIMVKSGLNDQDLYVNHIKLALHFIAAIALLAYTFWLGLNMLAKKSSVSISASLSKLNLSIIGLLIVQLIYGAFMAGLKAGVFAPTWPDINGAYLPPIEINENTKGPILINHPLMVHFIHRNLAYLLIILVAVWTIKAQKTINNKQFNISRWLPLCMVLLQTGLGILTVLTSYKAIPQGWGVFEWNAQLHQLFAIVLLLSLMLNQFLMKSRS